MNGPTDNRRFVLCALAIKLGFLNDANVREIIQKWSEDEQFEVRAYCIQRGLMTEPECDVLEAAVARVIQQHRDKEIEATRTTPEDAIAALLGALENQEGSLRSQVDLEATRDFIASIGASTSDDRRFQVLRPLARGGLGEVFIANDKQLNREVALKTLQDWHADKEDSQARFLVEAEITGRLEHPGIVPVYSLGRDYRQRPFYAMRWVRGSSFRDAIKQFCEQQSGLRTSERTVRFRKLVASIITICETVSYAHSRGILHRDIKPSNVIVGKFGETLLVDWGLAKVIGVEDEGEADEDSIRPQSGSSVQQTVAGSALGTPSFMSPEQAAGKVDQLDARSDVYSLGATLYFVLTGAPPFSKSSPNLLQQVQNGDFPSPLKLKPDLPKPLVSICLRAMAINGRDRYQSARELSSELEHWLADEPVMAHPDTTAAKLARAYRRNRRLFHAAAVFVLVAGLGSGIAAALIANKNQELKLANKIVSEQRDDAAEDFSRASQLAIKLLDIQNEELSKIPEKTGLRLSVSKQVRDAMKSFHERNPDNPEVQYSYARSLRYVGTLNASIGKSELAREQLRTATELFESAAKSDPDPNIRADYALALIDRAKLARRAGNLKEVQELLKKSLEIAAALVQEDPDNPAWRRTLAYAQSEQVFVSREIGQLDEAARIGAIVLETFKSLLGTPAEEPTDGPLLLLSYGSQIEVLLDAKRFEEALSVADEAIELAEQITAANEMADNIHMHARALHYRAKILLELDQENLSPVERDLSDAKEKLQMLTEQFPVVGRYRASYAQTRLTRAKMLVQQGKSDEAQQQVQTAVREFEEVYAALPLSRKKQLVPALEVKAELYAGVGDWLQAAATAQTGIELQQEVIDEMPDSNLQRQQLARLQNKLQNYRSQLDSDERQFTE